MFVFDTAYRVQQVTPAKLQVLGPASSFALLLFVCAAVITTYLVFRMYRVRSLFPLLGIALIGGLLVLAGTAINKAGDLLLDKGTNTATLYGSGLLWNHKTVIPLTTVRLATLEVVGVNSYITLVAPPAEGLIFGYSTRLDGKEEAVAAINRYIGAAGR